MYDAGSTATITADETDASGVPFARWEVTEGSVTLENAESRETSFTMPSEKVSVKAVYEAGDRYSVMVFGGTGAGIYEEGEIVTVTATEEPGKKFNCWYISADGSETVENDNASFSFEMPATDLITQQCTTWNSMNRYDMTLDGTENNLVQGLTVENPTGLKATLLSQTGKMQNLFLPYPAKGTAFLSQWTAGRCSDPL